MWNINVQCANVIEAIRPDILVIDKKERKEIIINITVPADAKVGGKKNEKMEKYKDLKKGIGRPWKTQNGRSRACSDNNP